MPLFIRFHLPPYKVKEIEIRKTELQCVPSDINFVKWIEEITKKNPSQKILTMKIVNHLD